MNDGKERIDMADELISFDNVYRVLQDFAKDIRDNYTEHLEFHNRYTQKRSLIDSVVTNVNTADGGFSVTMDLRSYWKYVEDDTAPHFPPLEAIYEWVKIKPIIPREFNGKLPTQKQLAYLIARKISQEGTKGSHDLQITKDNVIEWYRDKLAEALREDVKGYIGKVASFNVQ